MNYGIFLLLGTNQGDRKANLQDARERLQRVAGSIEAQSSVYKSAAWGMEDQPDFYNQVLKIASEHSSEVLLEKILGIEQAMGRVREQKWGPRLIDIDLLLYGNETRDTPFLHLPHPGIPSRRFVLVPLAEIAQDVVHPALHKPIKTLLAECADPLWVRRVDLAKDVSGLGKDVGGLGKDAGGLGKDAGGLGKDAGGLGKDVGGLGKDAGGLGKDAGGL